MRRYTITLGARTTAGGRVVTASSSGSIEGVPVALEGDLVECPQCRASGKILCVGPRIPEMSDGRQVALENDLCVCRCSPSPKLLTIQTMRSQVLKDTGHALASGTPWEERVRHPDAYNERFVLLDHETGAPLSNKEYAVVRASGKLEFGTSDSCGRTHMLSNTARAEAVEIYA